MSLMRYVRIRGGGVAGRGSAHLLARAGFQTVVESINRPRVPAIMLSETTQKLLQDTFDRPGLFRDLPRIRKRIVTWGAGAQPLTLPHSAVVISEHELLERICAQPISDDQTESEDAGWTIFTVRPLPSGAEELPFGSRIATSSRVVLIDSADREACWVESIAQGWLFLLPGEHGKGWLLSVGGPPDSLLAASRTVAEQITGIESVQGEFPAHPRVADPLCDTGWLACGMAALGFDPLCGDGAGHAVREAILCSAVIRAAADGADVASLVEHYRMRLLAGFSRHLEACDQFYRSGSRGAWWDQEIESNRRGLEWCRQRLEPARGFRYRLNGFTLEAVL
jgi:hypothetical protein